MLFWPGRRRRPGPKGPNRELTDAVVAMKRRNPSWGCPRIAQQIAFAFAIEIDMDVVRRILSAHYRPESDSPGPSWLTFLGHMKDRLWSCDLFRCESIILRTHWVLVVMDQFYATHHWVRRPPRQRGWSGPVPDVPSRDSRKKSSQIPQFGSRSAVPIPPMESYSSGS